MNQPEFHNVDKVKVLLSLLEQEDTLRDILETPGDSQGITIKIGSENSRQEIQNCSMITATYQVGDKILGTIGILGPTRMDYARVVTVIDCMSRNLSRTLERLLKGQG
ncbi:hypothetical protein P378_17245 [Desulforamulus profundi]|uniref:Heat-inducible transcription repressor HrcA C-terminal domain-containing protein n=1 Tax=Desulforamulus profundi TaxID=1383067 RepID=A0A2C6L1R7_9FIRM|nr:hypothetical protein P378_17245 [Desulforamulus profundi]